MRRQKFLSKLVNFELVNPKSKKMPINYDWVESFLEEKLNRAKNQKNKGALFGYVEPTYTGHLQTLRSKCPREKLIEFYDKHANKDYLVFEHVFASRRVLLHLKRDDFMHGVDFIFPMIFSGEPTEIYGDKVHMTGFFIQHFLAHNINDAAVEAVSKVYENFQEELKKNKTMDLNVFEELKKRLDAEQKKFYNPEFPVLACGTRPESFAGFK